MFLRFLRDSFSGFIMYKQKNFRHSELTNAELIDIYKKGEKKNYALKKSKFKYSKHTGNTSERPRDLNQLQHMAAKKQKKSVINSSPSNPEIQ